MLKRCSLSNRFSRRIYRAGEPGRTSGQRSTHLNAWNIVSAVVGAIIRAAVAIAVVYLIYRGAVICYDYGYRIFTEPAISSGEGRTVTVAVTEEMSASDIGTLLENKGLIRDKYLFVLQYYLSEYRKDVKPGVFELSTSMTAEDMMKVMASAAEEDETGQTEQ